MRKVLFAGFLCLAGLLALPAQSAAQIIGGSIAVLRVGDGSTALVNSGGPVTILQFQTNGSSAGPNISIPGTGDSGLQLSGTASSEGSLSLSADGTKLVFAGYNPGTSGFTGTGSLASRTSAQAPRGFGTVDIATGSYALGGVFSGTGTDFSANNIRSAYMSGSSVYAAGGNSGTVLYGTPTSSAVQTTNINTRVLAGFNGNLYFSTGAGTQGIYSLGSFPTASTTPTAALTGVTGQGTNPYGFAFSPGPLANGSVAYIADATLGVQKFTFNGSAWSFNYNMTATGNGLTGLAVDFAGVNPILYAVSPTAMFRFEDAGSSGAMTSIATAGTNFAFRGIALTPVPEPTSLALCGMALGGVLVSKLRRRK